MRATAAGARAFVPVPEPRPQARAEERLRGGRVDPIRIAILALAMAVGLAVVAVAADRARNGESSAYLLEWIGVAVIFLAGALGAWRARSRGEAVILLVLLGLALYLVKVVHSPLYFTFHDEFSTLRTTEDIALLGDPFHTNPLIPVHPFYPGLELTTDAVSSVTGLSIFTSALAVIGTARILLMIGIFLLFERVAPRPIAALGAALYATNPNFLFFDSQWAYESFALPIAVFVLALMASAPALGRAAGHAARILALILLGVGIVCHPMTSYALLACLFVWAVLDTWTARRSGGEPRRDLWLLFGAGIAIIAAWGLLVAPITGGYLGPVFGKAGSALLDLIAGESGAKRVFMAAGTTVTPTSERAIGVASILIALAATAIGIWKLRHKLTPLRTVLVLAAILYPVSLALRLTQAGTEISNRASEFVFIGVAFLAAVAAGAIRERVAAGARANLARPVTIAALAAAAVMFMGGVVIGWARYSRLPGPYLVVADPRSVEREGREAAFWARDWIDPRSRVLTDRANALLVGSIGRLDPQGGTVDGYFVPDVITSDQIDPRVHKALVEDDLTWLVIDKRLADGLPAVGVYFERDEPDGYAHTTPPSEEALVKFDEVCPVGRAFDSGDIVVYDARKVGGADCRLGREVGE